MNKLVKRGLGAMAIAVSAVGLFALLSTSYWNNLPNHRQVSEKRSAVLGAATLNNGLSVRVYNLNIQQPDPISGMNRVTVTVAISNRGSDTAQISPGLQFQLSDSTGRASNATARYLPPNKVLGGPITSGSSSVMDVDFDIPSDSTPKQLIFQQDLTTKAFVVEL